MTGVVEKTGNWLADFSAMAPAAQPWMQTIREVAFARFNALGFPTRHDEEWRFTNVAPIARTNWVAAAPATAALPEYATGIRLVFVNGRFEADLSDLADLPKGVKAGRISDDPAAAEPYLAKYAVFDTQMFVALNSAFLEDGAFLRISRGVVVEEPIHLVFLSVPGAQPAVAHPRTLIVTGADSQATIVESYIGVSGEPWFTNAVTEIVAGDGAVVDHYKVQMEGRGSGHVATLQAQVGRSGNFSTHSISMGGALVRNDANAVLGEGSHATVNGLYIVNGTQHVDNHTIIDHARAHATSHELYKGILDGRAQAVFNGKIIVRPDAQKTDSKQTNKNLVLSDEAVINTKPELQIWADDVRCTHGATIGQLDEEMLFYLRSRAIGVKEARSLLIYAFAQDIVDRIKVPGLRDSLEKHLFEKFHAA